MNKSKFIYFIAIVCALAGFYGWYSISNSKNQEIEIKNSEEENESQDSEKKLYVHISGEVNHPGVIEIESGKRVADGIEAAGGLTLDGDLNGVNLARKLKDEEKIEIPKLGYSEKNEGETAVEKIGLININTATVEELKTLPGIGDVLAKNIIDYREKNGSFTDLEELKNVPRIGNKLHENIVALITL